MIEKVAHGGKNQDDYGNHNIIERVVSVCLFKRDLDGQVLEDALERETPVFVRRPLQTVDGQPREPVAVLGRDREDAAPPSPVCSVMRNTSPDGAAPIFANSTWSAASAETFSNI